MRQRMGLLEVFHAIGQAGTIKGAAQALNLTPSTVSSHLKTLEQHMGTALFFRTTRSINLTEAGRILMDGTEPAFGLLSNAVASARRSGRAPAGTLKLTCPAFAYDQIISPIITSFITNYPDINLELSIADGFDDFFGAGFHGGLRFGDRVSEDMISLPVSKALPLAILASPQYLERHGEPKNPRELAKHRLIHYRFASSGKLAPWEFLEGDMTYSLEVKTRTIVNDIPTLIAMVRNGIGLGYSFAPHLFDAADQTALVGLLTNFIPAAPAVHFYFPVEYRSYLPLRVFIEALTNQAL